MSYTGYVSYNFSGAPNGGPTGFTLVSQTESPAIYVNTVDPTGSADMYQPVCGGISGPYFAYTDEGLAAAQAFGAVLQNLLFGQDGGVLTIDASLSL